MIQLPQLNLIGPPKSSPKEALPTAAKSQARPKKGNKGDEKRAKEDDKLKAKQEKAREDKSKAKKEKAREDKLKAKKEKARENKLKAKKDKLKEMKKKAKKTGEKPKKGSKEKQPVQRAAGSGLVMSRKSVYSRAYHKAITEASKLTWMNDADAKKYAREKGHAALKNAGFEPTTKCAKA